MKAVSIKIYQFSKWTLLALMICIALLSLAARALLSNAEYFKSGIEQGLADYGIKGVALENIEGQWQGLRPSLKINGASLSIPGRSDALFVNEISARVKLVPSLLSGELILESFHSSIEKLVLVRDDKGAWWLNGIPLSAANSGNTELDIYGFFKRLPSFVNIDIGLIQLRDLRQGTDYLIQDSRLRSSRKTQRLTLELITQLPSSLGHKMQFYLTGDAYNQQLLVQAERLDLAQLFELTSTKKIPLHKAIISMQSWIDLERFHVKQVVTEARVTQLSFNPAVDQTKHESASTSSASPKQKIKQQAFTFSIQSKASAETNQWRINTKFNKIEKGRQKFADLNTQLLIRQQGDNPLLWVDQIELPFINSILQDVVSDESVIKLLNGIQPVASIDNIVAELDIAKPIDSLFSFDLTDLHTRNYQSIPAINGVNGSLLFAQGISLLNIDSEQVSFNFDTLFRQPIKLDTLKAKSYIHYKNSTLTVDTESFSAANADIRLQGRLQLEAPAKGRPFLSLRANYNNGRVKAIPGYLPVGIMHKNVVKWVDKSLLSGRVTEGDFLFHGRLEKIKLFDKNQSGMMQAAFDASGLEVDYLADWPAVKQGEAKFNFVNSGLHVDVLKAKYVNSIVRNVNLDIPDFLHANLFLDTKINTSAKDLIATLSSLPILNVFDEVKQKATVMSGPISSDIKLDIPLTAALKKKIRVTASADLKGVSIKIPKWMIDFTELKGQLDIDNEKISAAALTGKYKGDKVLLRVAPQIKRKRTNLHLTGDVNTANFLTLMPRYLQHPVSGKSPWKISISVAHNSTKDSPILEIAADSSLLGTAFNFPQPSTVLQAEKRPIIFNAKLYDKGDFPFDLSLADNVKVSGRLNLQAETDNIVEWLNVTLGGPNTITKKSGVTIEGKTALIDLNDWFDFKKNYFSEEDTDSVPFLQQLNSARVDIGRLVLGNQQALNSKVMIINDGKILQGSINSKQLKGSFELPYRMGVLHPFKADFEYIKLSKPDPADKIEIDIADMPNLYIKSKLLLYEKMDFSDLILSSRNEADKFVVEQLDFSHDKVTLKSSGHWQFEPRNKEHVSVFNIAIKGDDFGKAVNDLGLGEAIQDAKVDFKGQIGWGGELYNINWPTLIGEVDLKLEDGFLRNIEPGAGRFVGLLSFNALPRRLFLDFGDVVKEGMQFNDIHGKFTINGEIMETDNASMDSVSAKIKIKGKTNLRHQTYDQNMTIIPKIGDTLPILGTIAAGNAVGWGLLLLHKIFKKPIEKSVGIKYTVTGTWDKPEVELIARPKIKQENDNFYDEEL